MSYLPHTDHDRQVMLEAVGAKDMEGLLEAIPSHLRLGRDLELPEALSEYELLRVIGDLASKNAVPEACFLGAGAYRHFVPTIVDAVTSRSEFITAYTPYQAEASQGTLQAIFEFQTMICRLTGMDVANASVYDGGTAAVDAALMAMAQTRRHKVLVSRGVHPHTREVLATYLAPGEGVIEEIPLRDGLTDLTAVDKDTACVIIQIPNFAGLIEDGPALCAKAHEAGAAAIVAVGDPVSLSVLKAPGAYGADICCGEGQALGNSLAFGGPYVGFLACKKGYLRRIPGRLVGMTDDHNGKRGFCLTLQAREQHIRREKASSNICSNQGLCALACCVHLALLGPEGLKKAALGSMAAAAELKKQLADIPGFSVKFAGPAFHEIVLQCPEGEASKLLEYLACEGVLGGFDMSADYPEFKDCILICCTELTTPCELDELVGLVKAYAKEVGK